MENELKCQKCGAMVDVHASECPQCGENLGEYTEQLPDNAYKIPRTIDELKQFYEDKSIPVRSMRFFIGEDYAAPKAFGVYKDQDGQFVVYKNKDTGERVVRYRGPDEAFAVREIYEKVKSEIDLRRNPRPQRHVSTYSSLPSYPPRSPRPPRVTRLVRRYRRPLRSSIFHLAALIIILFMIMVFVAVTGGRYSNNHSHRGYYTYGTTHYYHVHDDWYYYDPYDEVWIITETPDFYSYDYGRDYYTGSSYRSNDYYSDWDDSEWYDDYDSYDNSSESSWNGDTSSDWYDDYDYDSGSSWDSWDSSDTDWGSDW